MAEVSCSVLSEIPTGANTKSSGHYRSSVYVKPVVGKASDAG
ncbi:MAG: hypothetical protein QF535_16615 [Anaerolineales bacterium]|nr:hypothetical protein [Anaerolineales bacterium]